MTDKRIVLTTAGSSDEARKIARSLVERRLAACVNIFPGMVSIYRWESQIETASEVAMLVKTSKELESQVLDALAEKHPYTVPALVVFEPRRVAASYMEWLYNQTISRGAASGPK